MDCKSFVNPNQKKLYTPEIQKWLDKMFAMCLEIDWGMAEERLLEEMREWYDYTDAEVIEIWNSWVDYQRTNEDSLLFKLKEDFSWDEEERDRVMGE